MLWDYPPSDIFLMGFFLLGVSFILAWISDSILESAGFGVFGNTFFIFISAIIGTICLNMYGYGLEEFPILSFFTISSICFSLFFTTLILKRAAN